MEPFEQAPFFLSLHPGLFSDSHMEYDIHPDTAGEPSLAEMTEKAIQILQKNPNGFFLLVEGRNTNNRCCFIRLFTSRDSKHFSKVVG